MSIPGVLHVRTTKNGFEYHATFTNAKNKEVTMVVQASTYRFDPAKAVEGDVVVLKINTSGQIESCTIPGKEAVPPAQKQKQTAKHGSYQAYAPSSTQNRSNTGGSNNNSTPPLTDATAPYNFIPYVHEAVLPPFPDENKERWSGVIRCTLKALTPLLVAGPQSCKTDGGERRFLHVNGKPVIPGSSIKGLIRSVVEVLSFSYMRPMNDKPLFWRRGKRERLMYKHRPADVCRHDDKPDFASTLFGTVQKESRKGRVAFESTVVQGTEDITYTTVLGQPSPTSVAHYVTQTLNRIRTMSGGTKNDPQTLCSYEDDIRTLRLRGRKWYWHRDKDVPPPPSGNQNVPALLKPLKAEATAVFTIRVDNVTSLELGALLTALELPKGHAHKLGLGKSLGFGSIRIAIDSADVHHTAQQYTSLMTRYAGSRPDPLTDEKMCELRKSFKQAVATEVGKRYAAWKNLTYEDLPPIKTLRRMMDYAHRPSNEKTAAMSLNEFKSKAVLLPVEDMGRQQRGA